MNAKHTFTHEIQWHWVVGGIAVVAVVWGLSDSSLVEETDLSKEDAAVAAGQVLTN